MSRDVAEGHQVGGRGWMIPTLPETQARRLPVWAQTVELLTRRHGDCILAAVAPDNDQLQKSLTFNPIYLTDGVQLSDDPFIALRSAVYALSVRHRH